MRIVRYIKLLRPQQWTKNLFIFAALLFAGQLLNSGFLLKSLIAFIAFCGISSTVYIINDIVDIEADRIHKKKRFRPLASGEVTVKQAIIFLIPVFIISVFLTITLHYYFWITAGLYIIINTAYTFKVKDIVLLDVFFISFGFILRVAGGAAAISVPISSWMILTTIFISLFLAVSKRRAELSLTESENIPKQRKVLDQYDIVLTDQMNTIAATGTIICYALYTVSPRTVEHFRTENLIYTTPFVIYGIFRYLYLIHKKNLGESPSSTLIKDIPLIINTFLWLIISVIIIYKQRIINLLF